MSKLILHIQNQFIIDLVESCIVLNITHQTEHKTTNTNTYIDKVIQLFLGYTLLVENTPKKAYLIFNYFGILLLR